VVLEGYFNRVQNQKIYAKIDFLAVKEKVEKK
jgi:hypothetical protein